MEFPVDELAAQIQGPCLFSTIFACQIDLDTGEAVEALYDKAGKYYEAVSQAIRDFHTDEYPTNDLMWYFKLPDDPGMEMAVKGKVRSARVGVAAVGDTLYAKLELDLAADLTPDEMDAFTEQIGSQYWDGWGAAFEVMDIPFGEDGIAVRFWQDDITFWTELASTSFQRQPDARIDKDAFWELIAQAKEHTGGPSEWLMEQLMDLGPEQAKKFDDIACAYTSLAYQYGLWTAASVMERGGCTDDGFIDFRGWLIAQGREVYMAALADPDSLADAPDYQDQHFVCLPHMGDRAYEKLTGREIYEEFDPARYDALKAELTKDIVYGDGIGYPYDATDVPAYLPRLCQRYMPEGVNIGAWNGNSLEIRAARATAQKSKKIKKDRGESR